MQVIVDDLLVNYLRSGKGKTVLLLHGWGDKAASLQSLHVPLSKQFDCLAPDLPGFGSSQMPASAWGLDDYASFLAEFIKKLDIKELYAIVGHSNGGAIAIRGLATSRLTSQRLVLLASGGIRGTYKGRTKALRYITKLGKVLSTPLPASTKTRLRRQVYTTIGSDMLVAEHLQTTFKKILTDDVRSDATKLKLPTLLIYGDKDNQTPLNYGEIFHERIAGSTLKVLPGAGHFVFLEEPKAVIQSIQEFLK